MSKQEQAKLAHSIHQKGLQQYGRKGWRELSDAEQKAFIARGVLHHLVRGL
jgi:ABC-type cobalamin/Fe3+-siderophores transport system ATPase subunit